MTIEDKASVQGWTRRWQAIHKVCPPAENLYKDLAAYRRCLEEHAFPPIIEKLQRDFSVRVQAQTIAGVHVETITPSDGVAEKNRHRVLINLHGGGFVIGGRYIGRMESVPIAAMGRIAVVSVDYRVAPESQFPAATEDAVAVYEALLAVYENSNIGIYGCSAGGLLTAQTVAWLQTTDLPRPGAVGMFCAGAISWAEGDSARFGAAYYGNGFDAKEFNNNPYFKGVDLNDQLISPAKFPRVIANFPPSLLISSTRDPALSSVAYTHAMLVSEGVEADLHLWDGVEHGFLTNSELSQSIEAYKVIVDFFDKHLGAAPRTTKQQ